MTELWVSSSLGAPRNRHTCQKARKIFSNFSELSFRFKIEDGLICVEFYLMMLFIYIERIYCVESFFFICKLYSVVIVIMMTYWLFCSGSSNVSVNFLLFQHFCFHFLLFYGFISATKQGQNSREESLQESWQFGCNYLGVHEWD